MWGRDNDDAMTTFPQVQVEHHPFEPLEERPDSRSLPRRCGPFPCVGQQVAESDPVVVISRMERVDVRCHTKDDIVLDRPEPTYEQSDMELAFHRSRSDL
jgi:hypothetical protein